MSINVLEHSSDKYPPRTYHNASNADLTIAFAIDFDTAGERLTERAAKGKYLRVIINQPDFDSITSYISNYQPKIINIAGNSEKRFTDKLIPLTYVRDVIKCVITYISSICRPLIILSGGQTGADIIGASVAHELGIATEVMLPRGYVQRDKNGRDAQHSKDDIINQIRSG